VADATDTSCARAKAQCGRLAPAQICSLLEDFLATFTAGQYIKHVQYGCGIIVKYGPDRTTIDFDTHGLKLFVTSMMVVEPCDGIPPKRRRAKRVKVAKPAPSLPAAVVFVPGAK
jgi:hypothetical protein